MPFEHWLLFAGTEFVAYLVPGPAVLLVLSTALNRGSRAGVSASLGVLLAEVAFFLASATGIGLLLVRMHHLFRVIKWAGAAYLIWLGIETIRASGDRSQAFGKAAAPQRCFAAWGGAS